MQEQLERPPSENRKGGGQPTASRSVWIIAGFCSSLGNGTSTNQADRLQESSGGNLLDLSLQNKVKMRVAPPLKEDRNHR